MRCTGHSGSHDRLIGQPVQCTRFALDGAEAEILHLALFINLDLHLRLAFATEEGKASPRRAVAAGDFTQDAASTQNIRQPHLIPKRGQIAVRCAERLQRAAGRLYHYRNHRFYD